ncbi:MAG: DUF3289 family protein [Crocinitomix sp.]|nr:DUF3289 family protein [Crocinitomix sp.]
MYQGEFKNNNNTIDYTNHTFQYGESNADSNPYGYIDHKVKDGEILGELAKKYGVSKKQIIDANADAWTNHDRKDNWIYKDEVFKIPIETKSRYDIELIKKWIEENKNKHPDISSKVQEQTPNENLEANNRIIAQSDRRPGEDGNDIRFGEDSPFNDPEALLEACPNCDNEMNKTNDELFDIMTSQSRWVGVGELQTNNDAMIQRFQESTGGFYENDILTEKVRSHPSTQRFIKEIERTFHKALKENNGSAEDLLMELYDGDGGNPRFNSYGDIFFGGLTFAINDMQMYDIELTNIEYPFKGRYSAQINLIMYDHFGLDETDPTEYTYDVFESWFVLQHNRGFQPFITRVVIPLTISGGLNENSERFDNLKHHQTKNFSNND